MPTSPAFCEHERTEDFADQPEEPPQGESVDHPLSPILNRGVRKGSERGHFALVTVDLAKSPPWKRASSHRTQTTPSGPDGERNRYPDTAGDLRVCRFATHAVVNRSVRYRTDRRARRSADRARHCEGVARADQTS